MKLNARLIILIAVFVVMVVYLLFDRGIIGGGEGESGVFGIGGTPEPTKQIAALSANRRSVPIRELNWVKTWDEDPFFYAEAETTNAGETSILGTIMGNVENVNFKLGGISWRGNQGAALINGNVLAEGDRISGYQVTKIAYDHVILRRGTNIVRIALNE